MREDTHHEEDGEARAPVSKTRLKREARALFDFGRALVELPAAEFERLDLPDELRHAVREGRRIHSHIARKRQLQHIGKLLRRLDAEPLRQQLAHVQGRADAARAEFHRLERWRDRLIDEGDAALAEFLDRHPAADRQHLRQLVRNARRERAAGKPSRHASALFRAIRPLLAAAGEETT